MAKRSIKHWFLTRFVTISEVIGYALALGVIGFAIVTWFIQVDVTVAVRGKLQLDETVVALDSDAVLLAYQAGHGDPVAEGAPVARVAERENDRTLALGLRKLEAAVGLLKRTADADIAALVAGTEGRDLKAASRVQGSVLEAPAAGLLEQVAEVGDQIVPGGVTLLRIHNPAALRLEGAVPAGKEEKVAVGMPVRVTHETTGETIVGEVVGLVVQDDTTTARVRFDSPPEAVKTHLRDVLFGDAAEEEADSVTASIIVDQQTLFSRLFSKRQ